MSKPLLVFLAGAVLAVIAVGLFTPPEEVNRIGQLYEDEGNKHIDSLSGENLYKSDPPTSGTHYYQAAAWGVSDMEIPAEQWIHNLEHGGMVITYKPNLSEEKIAKLRDIAENLTLRDDQTERKGFKVILTPRAANTSVVQLSSWRYGLKLDDVDADKIERFYRDRPNNAPEPNAA